MTKDLNPRNTVCGDVLYCRLGNRDVKVFDYGSTIEVTGKLACYDDSYIRINAIEDLEDEYYQGQRERVRGLSDKHDGEKGIVVGFRRIPLVWEVIYDYIGDYQSVPIITKQRLEWVLLVSFNPLKKPVYVNPREVERLSSARWY